MALFSGNVAGSDDAAAGVGLQVALHGPNEIQAGESAKAMKVQFGRVSKSGRISLPAAFRLAIGLEQGGDVVIELADNEIKIRTIRESVARVQARARQLFGDRPDVSVDDFLAHRREDWGEE